MSSANNHALPKKHPSVITVNVASYRIPVFATIHRISASHLGADASASPARASFVTCDPAHTSDIVSAAILNAVATVVSGGSVRSVHAVVNARV